MVDGEQAEIYPPPPPWYKLYRQDAEGSAERPLPPDAPLPVLGDFEMFGVMDSTAAGVPPLVVKQLFEVASNGSVDFKGELQRLNNQLFAEYVGLVDTLIDRPSSYGRDVEALSTIFRNMHYLLNYLRCHQARASLKYVLEIEAQDRRAAAEDLRARREKTQDLLGVLASRLLEAGNWDILSANSAVSGSQLYEPESLLTYMQRKTTQFCFAKWTCCERRFPMGTPRRCLPDPQQC